jgi:hypothetical protein
MTLENIGRAVAMEAIYQSRCVKIDQNRRPRRSGHSREWWAPEVEGVASGLYRATALYYKVHPS